MPFFTRTDLGREVAVEDWRGWHTDRLLGMLVQMRDLGVELPAMDAKTLDGSTGLSAAHTIELVRLLVKQKHLRRRGKTYELTDNGVEYVRSAKSNRPCDKCGHTNE